MTLRRNALYYYLRSQKISSSAIARENHVTRQSFQQQLNNDFRKLRLSVFIGVAKVTGKSIPDLIDQTTET